MDVGANHLFLGAWNRRADTCCENLLFQVVETSTEIALSFRDIDGNIPCSWPRADVFRGSAGTRFGERCDDHQLHLCYSRNSRSSIKNFKGRKTRRKSSSWPCCHRRTNHEFRCLAFAGRSTSFVVDSRFMSHDFMWLVGELCVVTVTILDDSRFGSCEGRLEVHEIFCIHVLVDLEGKFLMIHCRLMPETEVDWS